MGLLVTEKSKALSWPPPSGPVLWCIIPLWRGETVTIIAGGPSLTQEQVDMVRGKTRIIAVNDAYRLTPWADILYGCDVKWWEWHKGVPDFKGIKAGLRWDAIKGKFHGGWTADIFPDVRSLASTGANGLEIAPNSLRTGSNSGYQAINLAVHMGAKRILLLGYDMKSDGKKNHWFGEHPNKVIPPYTMMLPYFKTIVEPLEKAGIEVINCTPDSALKVFPMMKLEEALHG